MNVLVIGNGFDLAHGLPTKYGDFLDFLYHFKEEEKKRKMIQVLTNFIIN